MTESKPFVCYWGAYCAHAILAAGIRVGVYRCPFGGTCFKQVEAERMRERAKK